MEVSPFILAAVLAIIIVLVISVGGVVYFTFIERVDAGGFERDLRSDIPRRPQVGRGGRKQPTGRWPRAMFPPKV